MQVNITVATRYNGCARAQQMLKHWHQRLYQNHVGWGTQYCSTISLFWQFYLSQYGTKYFWGNSFFSDPYWRICPLLARFLEVKYAKDIDFRTRSGSEKVKCRTTIGRRRDEKCCDKRDMMKIVFHLLSKKFGHLEISWIVFYHLLTTRINNNVVVEIKAKVAIFAIGQAKWMSVKARLLFQIYVSKYRRAKYTVSTQVSIR